MSDEVRLADVTRRNWRAVARLELAPDQEDLVASNLYSIAQSKFDPNARPRAIYAGDTIVGFIMYDVWREDDAMEASIYRFMIDRRYQAKGYGRAALAAALAEIRAVPGIARITISYMPNNPVAKPFYGSFGFVETGLDDDGEMQAELVV